MHTPLNQLPSALVREAGCGVFYQLTVEDGDEREWEFNLNRDEAEKLYAILGQMLGKGAQPPMPTQAYPTEPPNPFFVQSSPLMMPPFNWPPNFGHPRGW